ncbi:MAG: hypothetical protein FWC13_04355 [Oscillospiraceae bacterium]|nr:hypothetical protein [Oscillospiraceae bacterium]
MSISSAEIKKKALELGFTSCGIIPAIAFDEYRQSLDERIKAFPQAKEHYAKLYDLVNPPKEAKSIIVCVVPYNKYKVSDFFDGLIGKMYLFDDRIPYSDGFRANKEFEMYLQTGNLKIIPYSPPDRWAAAKANVAKFGRNNFSYSHENGSYIVIATWTVDKELDYDEISQDIQLKECSDKCHLCVKACPTNAMTDGFEMNRSRCVAQLSFGAEDSLDAKTREQMGAWIYGCDVCQDVCPVNKGKLIKSEEFPLLSQFEDFMKPENILTMDDDTYINIVNPRFFYIGEDGFWMWQCNALRNLINSENPKHYELIKSFTEHENPHVREVAKWGCEKLGIE